MNWVWPMAPAQEPVRWDDVDVAVLQDLQRGDELGARIFGARRIGIGERGQRAHDVAHLGVVLEHLAVIRLHRPDRQQDGAVDAEALLDAVEPGLPLARHLLAGADRALVDAVVEILPGRVVELGLVVRLRPAPRDRARRRCGTPCRRWRAEMPLRCAVVRKLSIHCLKPWSASAGAANVASDSAAMAAATIGPMRLAARRRCIHTSIESEYHCRRHCELENGLP